MEGSSDNCYILSRKTSLRGLSSTSTISLLKSMRAPFILGLRILWRTGEQGTPRCIVIVNWAGSECVYPRSGTMIAKLLKPRNLCSSNFCIISRGAALWAPGEAGGLTVCGHQLCRNKNVHGEGGLHGVHPHDLCLCWEWNVRGLRDQHGG